MAAAAATIDIGDNSLDIWRKIPPEEKLEIMARAQSRGLFASLVLLTVAGTVAIGLRHPWLFWSAFLTIPFVFQFFSAKAWRDVKPRTVLEYLAARSALRRYAYTAHSKDLTINLIFRGTLQPVFDQESIEEQLEARVAQAEKVDVWVALFPDTIVMISERSGGGKLEFAQNINERLTIRATGFDEDSDDEKSITLSVVLKAGNTKAWRLTTPYNAALYVFERRIRQFEELMRLQAEKDRQQHREMFAQFSMEEDA